MKKTLFVAAAAAALLAVGVGVWYASSDDAPAAPEVFDATARGALDRALDAGKGIAAADWIKVGAREGEETGRYARYRIVGADGREAWAYLVRLDDGSWHVVSITEGAPQCAAVEKFGFPSAMIADCRVGETQTVAEALAAAIAGGDVSGVRLVGQISLPPDPSCNCVLLTSGGASVRLNISASDLAAAGIGIGDTVVISGGLGGNLSVDASSVIRAGGDGTPDSVSGFGNGSEENGSGNGTGDTGSGSSGSIGTRPPKTTPPEPAGQAQGVTGGGATGVIRSVPNFPEWKPRIRYTTSWYASPLDIDTSTSEVPTLGS